MSAAATPSQHVGSAATPAGVVDKKGCCLLSLDGGGVRGLSELYILRIIMAKLNHELATLGRGPVKPCDVFDLIGGTSTGGLIAIMLGRLRMDVDECIKAYQELAGVVFSKPRHRLGFNLMGNTQARFDSAKLKNAILTIIERCGLPHDAPLDDGQAHGCKVFVCATTVDLKGVQRLRTYTVPGATTEVSCTIVEAALATTAGPTFFDSIKIDNLTFVDGALEANNPIEELENEATNIWASKSGDLRSVVKCMVSIGTGNPGKQPVAERIDQVVRQLVKMATETETTAAKFKQRWRSLYDSKAYFRFNVEQGLQDVGLEKHEEQGRIHATTLQYMEDQTQASAVRDLVENLKLKEDSTPCNLEEESKTNIPLHLDRIKKALWVTNPERDKARIEDRKGGLLRDVYGWILDSDEFRDWRNDEGGSLLWIEGGPGKGKTMLLCGIIDELRKVEDHRVLFFFFQGTDARINTPTSVLRTLIHLLLVQQPKLGRHLEDEYGEQDERTFVDQNAWISLSALLSKMLSDPALGPTYLVIDALDECTGDIGALDTSSRKLPGLQRLLRFMVENSNLPGVKWIISSRDLPQIEERLRDTGHRCSLERNPDSVSKAIDKYVKHKVSELAMVKKYDQSKREAVQEYLSSNSEGTFLWVALVCEQLDNVSQAATMETLSCMPPDLDGIYDLMLDQINRQQSTDPEICKETLAIMLTAYRPLSVAELASLFHAFDGTSGNLDPVRDLVSRCGSFLTTRDDIITFIHQSAKEFLLRKDHSKVFHASQAEVHEMLFLRSLMTLEKTLQRDIYHLGHPATEIETVQKPMPDPLAPARYSCAFWADHLVAAGRCISKEEIETRAQVFLETKLLHWFEALSLMGSMSEGVLAIRKVHRLLLVEASRKASQLRQLIRDVQRFILYHRWVIEKYPLQVYVSALVFSPSHSLVRGIFEHEVPQWITVKPYIEQWNACHQTLQGHSTDVLSVAFSADGRQLVSASKSQVARVWDPTTGTCLRRFKEPSGELCCAQAISSDGVQLALWRSHQPIIEIWNLETAKVRTRMFITDESRSKKKLLAFSSDGTQVAFSATLTREVNIFNLRTGAHKVIQDRDDLIEFIAFSPDGSFLAVRVGYWIIELWDLRTGACQLTLVQEPSPSHFSWNYDYDDLVGHTFSSDGTYLAAAAYMQASSDHVLILWNLKTGKREGTFRGQTPLVSVAFSPNNTLLAASDYRQAVTVWDTRTGSRWVLRGHSDIVNSLAFSPDGLTLATASNDRTVRIWDIEEVVSQPPGDDAASKHHAIPEFKISRDGTMLVTMGISPPHKIRCWDTATGEQLYEAITVSLSSDSVALSLDNKQFASLHWGGHFPHRDEATLQIWDLATGVCQNQQTITEDMCKSRRYWPLRFSRDGGHIHTPGGVLDLARDSFDVLSQPCSCLSPDSPPLARSNYGVAFNRSWITFGGQAMIWIPPDFRPDDWFGVSSGIFTARRTVPGLSFWGFEERPTGDRTWKI